MIINATHLDLSGAISLPVSHQHPVELDTAQSKLKMKMLQTSLPDRKFPISRDDPPNLPIPLLSLRVTSSVCFLATRQRLVM